MHLKSIVGVACSVAVVTALVAVPLASGEQASSDVRGFQAGLLDVGDAHSCAILTDGSVRCWGSGDSGRLGYGNTNNIGDTETPASAGAVNLGVGRTARAITAGDYHTCAILDDGNVRCWGAGGGGRLGYGNLINIGDTETPDTAGPVNFGPGRTARAISASDDHTCVVQDDGNVRCWGFNAYGQLGYGHEDTIGDTESPASVVPVNLGTGRTALTTTTGDLYSCALLDDRTVRCWGSGTNGKLGYGNTDDIGDNEAPGSVGPVDLGRPAVAITAGGAHTCALLDNGTVRCWGSGGGGRLGYGNTDTIGDNETPASAGPVDLGGTAVAITAGGGHTCALLDNGDVRCWGLNTTGQLGYGHTLAVGDNETPATAGSLDLAGPAVAISAGSQHTCAMRFDGLVLCWGSGGAGRLGYSNTDTVGNDEQPRDYGTLSLGGSMLGAVGDLSLAMSSDFATREVGQDVRITLTLSAGPDGASGVAVGDMLPAGLALVGASASQGTYDAATGQWQVGTLAPGSATLELTARVSAVGSFTNVGEVSASSSFDPDSSPGNGAPGEDDRAALEITGTPGTGGVDATPPAISELSFARARFKAGAGSRVRYTLSEAASVRFRVERAAPGRRTGGRCRKPTLQNRTRPRCTRYVKLRGSITRSGYPGPNSFKFTGRLRGRKLRPGRYRLVATARDAAGNASSPKRAKFRIVLR